ncbi:MAG: DinB family protein [Chloroflexi bacterium]|nr:DinB family protein [Chloroflexota bacterium]MDA1227249.1 DinB family protein [Chloroflexota bacterium]
MRLGDFIEETLEDYYGRVNVAIEPLTSLEMAWRPSPEANSIAFIYWHVARVEDGWTNSFGKGESAVWQRDRWHERLGLAEKGSGFGLSVEELAAFPDLPKDLLQEYFTSVRQETLAFLRGLGESDFDYVPNRTPFPETAGTVSRFRSFSMARMYRQLIGEEDQHLGQISYVRGLQRGLNN